MSENIIKVNMLGEFSVSADSGGEAVSDRNNRSKKVLTLLEYLVTFRDREIPQNELIELLWPDDNSDEPANTLKTLLHRARAALDELGPGMGKAAIVCRRGAYAWNNELETTVDAEEFERLCHEAQTVEGEARLARLLSAVRLYRGDFLPKSGGELWAMPIATYYHSMYLNAVHETLELLTRRARFDEIIAICQQAVAIDPFDEPLHLVMIQTLMACGMQQKAMTHYTQVTELYLNKFGINPSPELTALYKEIVKAEKSTEMNLNIIRDELRETETRQGAFFCEYEFFKDIYRLQARSSARSGGVVQIALITLMDSAGHLLNRKQMTLAMSRLQEVIRVSLRNSDIFARFSVSQYLIMLPSASLEDSEMVLQRVSGNFRREYPHMSVLLHYSSLPMEPTL
ncbi:MAG: BTAD domain-containing putative transcriptional regulator [Oscillospiraceae bacterium]